MFPFSSSELCNFLGQLSENFKNGLGRQLSPSLVMFEILLRKFIHPSKMLFNFIRICAEHRFDFLNLALKWSDEKRSIIFTNSSYTPVSGTFLMRMFCPIRMYVLLIEKRKKRKTHFQIEQIILFRIVHYIILQKTFKTLAKLKIKSLREAGLSERPSWHLLKLLLNWFTYFDFTVIYINFHLVCSTVQSPCIISGPILACLVGCKTQSIEKWKSTVISYHTLFIHVGNWNCAIFALLCCYPLL